MNDLASFISFVHCHSPHCIRFEGLCRCFCLLCQASKLAGSAFVLASYFSPAHCRHRSLFDQLHSRDLVDDHFHAFSLDHICSRSSKLTRSCNISRHFLVCFVLCLLFTTATCLDSHPSFRQQYLSQISEGPQPTLDVEYFHAYIQDVHSQDRSPRLFSSPPVFLSLAGMPPSLVLSISFCRC